MGAIIAGALGDWISQSDAVDEYNRLYPDAKITTLLFQVLTDLGVADETLEIKIERGERWVRALGQ